MLDPIIHLTLFTEGNVLASLDHHLAWMGKAYAAGQSLSKLLCSFLLQSIESELFYLWRLLRHWFRNHLVYHIINITSHLFRLGRTDWVFILIVQLPKLVLRLVPLNGFKVGLFIVNDLSFVKHVFATGVSVLTFCGIFLILLVILVLI